LNYKILNLEWTSYPSRDREAATLISNYLRIQVYSVFEGSIFEGYHLINKINPKILFITNTTGALINQSVTRYEKQRNIKVITSISEGDIKNESIEEMTWGTNNLYLRLFSVPKHMLLIVNTSIL